MNCEYDNSLFGASNFEIRLPVSWRIERRILYFWVGAILVVVDFDLWQIEAQPSLIWAVNKDFIAGDPLAFLE